MHQAVPLDRLHAAYNKDNAENYRTIDNNQIATAYHKHTCEIIQSLTMSFNSPINALDIGCGSGRYFHCLRNTRSLLGVDISPFMLEQAKNPVLKDEISVTDIKLICGNIFELNLPSGSFNFVYSIGVLGEYSPFHEGICSKIYDLLTDGGIAFFTIVDSDSKQKYKSLKRRVTELIMPFLPHFLAKRIERRLQSLYLRYDEVKSILSSSQFTSFEINRFEHPPSLWQGAHFEVVVHKSCSHIRNSSHQEVQHRTEERLYHLQKMDALRQLAGKIGHDFRNTLIPFFGYGKVIKTHSENQQINAYADMIIEAAHDANTIISRLLNFSRNDSTTMAHLDISEIARKAADTLRKSTSPSIIVSFENHTGTTNTLVDNDAVQNSLLALGTNAQEALSGTGTITFSVFEKHCDVSDINLVSYKAQPGHYIGVSVRDTGCGMDDTTRSRLFEPYFTTKKKGQNEGLSLSSVYGCMRRHHGFITVETASGNGSVFTLFFPVTPSQ